MKRIQSFIVAASALLFVQAAQSATFQELYNSARVNDPVLGGAEANYDARKEFVPQTRSALLPLINLQGSTSWNQRDFLGATILDTDPTSPTFGQQIGAPRQEFNSHGWNASVRQAIVDLPSWYNFRSSLALRDQAGFELAAVEQNLIVRVADAYLNVLRAQAAVEATEAEEEAVKRQLEQVQQRFDVGLVAITDVLESTAAFDSAHVRRIQADGDHDIFFETLRTITGVAYETVERLSSGLPVIDPSPSDAEEWVNTALVTNFTILSAEDALKAAERDLQAKLSGHLPTIDAVASHQHTVTGGAAFLGNKLDQDVFSLQATLPIYQGGFVHSRYKESRARVEEARQRLIERELIVTRDARNFFRAVVTDVVRVGARIKAIKSGEAALEATQTGYEVGTRNIVDVLRAQQQLFLAQFDYADSRYNYVGNLLRLKQIAGTLDEDDVAELATFNTSTDPIQHRSRLRQP
ncbi:MAG: TolC family outer membrane protein [Gammaproteobacteria bacterium]|nr:TolC family outer membrane protein [Gammaproteobacteria bacterium]